MWRCRSTQDDWWVVKIPYNVSITYFLALLIVTVYKRRLGMALASLAVVGRCSSMCKFQYLGYFYTFFFHQFKTVSTSGLVHSECMILYQSAPITKYITSDLVAVESVPMIFHHQVQKHQQSYRLVVLFVVQQADGTYINLQCLSYKYLLFFSAKKGQLLLVLGPWWWSSVQRARLLLQRSEFESR